MISMRFRIGSAEVFLSFWFFAVAALFTAVNVSVFSLYIVAPMLVHELGHLLAMAACKAKISAVRFTAFGIEIEKSRSAGLSLPREIMISFAGIAANLVLAAGLYLFAFQSMRVMLLIAANAAVAVFNLLPIGNLDGGEAARMLCGYYLRPRLAYTLSRAFSFVALTPLFAASIFLLMQPERNFTLLLICVYLLLDIITKG